MNIDAHCDKRHLDKNISQIELTVDSSMSSVCPSPLFHGTVDLHMVDVQVVNIKTLGLDIPKQI